MFNPRKKRLGDLLTEAGLISDEQLSEALLIQKRSGERLGKILTDKKFVSENDIIRVLEFQLGIPHVSFQTFDVDPEATKKISENLAKRHELIPIKIIDGALMVAMSDPLNIFALDDVEIYSGMEVQPAIASGDEIRRAIDIFYGKQEAMKAAEEYKKEYGSVLQPDKIEGSVEEMVYSAPIVKLVTSILEQGVRMRASDIHIEPFEDHIRIRYRMDGRLEEVMKHDMQLLPAIVTRIKITGNMNIAEKRRPQDGRFTVKVDALEYDMRVSTLPTMYGEKVAIRITDKKALQKPKEQLGFFPDDLTKYNEILKNPHGIILITGPTGSGKTTTLYTTLKELNREDINIITVEDPVEATIEGINQVQVNPKAGLDFSTALRSILRQDPDIIMVGEIRDGETAEIAVKAAVTGHLVVSTLHTNDAPGTITRLLDMGIEPFLIGTSVVGVISQRLVKRLCLRCREPYLPSEAEMNLADISGSKGSTLYRAKGCKACNRTGYQGRVGLYEIMPVSPELRRLINQRASADEIRLQAVKEGMNSLKRNCSRLVVQGITSMEELVRVAYSFE